MHEASAAHNLTCYSPTDAPHLRFTPLAEAERLWQEAEAAAAEEPALLERIKVAHLPLGYVWLSRWTQLRKESERLGAAWPLPDSQEQVAQEWMATSKGVPGKSWTKITLLNEGGLTPDKWIAKFTQQPGPSQ